jgi:hypothetical protein
MGMPTDTETNTSQTARIRELSKPARSRQGCESLPYQLFAASIPTPFWLDQQVTMVGQ